MTRFMRLLRAARAVRLGVLVLGLFAIATPATAQDVLWTGYYAGLNAGGSWGSPGTDIGCVDTFGAPACPGGIAAGAFLTQLSANLAGFIGGGQVGYNFQSGHMVYGFEGDIDWTSTDGSRSQGTSSPTDTIVTTVSQELNWLATARGRLGYAANSWLLYLTGGLAVGNVDNRYSFVVSNGQTAIASASTVRAGWIAGGGAEYSFGCWTLKGEVLYYDLGNTHREAPVFNANGSSAGTSFLPNFKTSGEIARAGVNFPLN